MNRLELFTLRLEPESVGRIEKIATAQHLPLRTLMRSWLLQRLDEELKLNSGLLRTEKEGEEGLY